jgi:hypothetical protein
MDGWRELGGDVLPCGLVDGDAVVVLGDGVSVGCALASEASRLRHARSCGWWAPGVDWCVPPLWRICFDRVCVWSSIAHTAGRRGVATYPPLPTPSQQTLNLVSSLPPPISHPVRYWRIHTEDRKDSCKPCTGCACSSPHVSSFFRHGLPGVQLQRYTYDSSGRLAMVTEG